MIPQARIPDDTKEVMPCITVQPSYRFMRVTATNDIDLVLLHPVRISAVHEAGRILKASVVGHDSFCARKSTPTLTLGSLMNLTHGAPRASIGYNISKAQCCGCDFDLFLNRGWKEANIPRPSKDPCPIWNVRRRQR